MTSMDKGYVDLHSHVLPGLDDGAPDAATSSKMLDALARLGVTTQCVTPHQKLGQYLPSQAQIANAFAALAAARAPHHPALVLGAENMWDAVFYERSERDEVPGYAAPAATARAFLFELPSGQLPVGLLDRLFRFRTAGALPVMAHPERYTALWNDDRLVDALFVQAAFVVDLPAVAGYHGKQEAKMARRLLERGRCHAVATDAHTPEDVHRAYEGMAWIEKKLGDAALARLFAAAPAAILAGELPEPPP